MVAGGQREAEAGGEGMRVRDGGGEREGRKTEIRKSAVPGTPPLPLLRCI